MNSPRRKSSLRFNAHRHGGPLAYGGYVNSVGIGLCHCHDTCSASVRVIGDAADDRLVTGRKRSTIRTGRTSTGTTRPGRASVWCDRRRQAVELDLDERGELLLCVADHGVAVGEQEVVELELTEQAPVRGL